MLELVFRFFLYVIVWLLSIPLVFVVATPIIFIFALFRREGTFVSNMKDEYGRVWEFWKEWGIFLMP
jgi:low affinity Fe/Cu permease